MLQLSRGQKQKLAAVTSSLRIEAGLEAQGPGLTFDFSCFGVDAADQLSDDRYFVFYNQKASPNGEIEMKGNGTFNIDLSKLPASLKKLVFVVTIDGNGTLAALTTGSFQLSDGAAAVARFEFKGSDFGAEKAIIAAEIYLKDEWRLAAVGQGFAGGLDALLTHFGGEASESAAPASAPAPSAPTPAAAAPPPAAAKPAAPPVNLKKAALDIKLEKQAPQLVSLVKQATISLEKSGLAGHTAKVALCLDISASMTALYRAGTIQKFAEKVLALGTRFDDDGAIDIFLFGSGAHEAGEMNIDNFADFIAQIQRRYPLEGGTNYGKAMAMIRSHYFGGSGARSTPLTQPLPVYVMFLTDGQTMDTDATRKQVQWSSYEPMFWQFMGIGKSRKEVGKAGGGFWARTFASDFSFLEELDNMSGRHIDNANFFSVADPNDVPDSELYDLLMSEYPDWVKNASTKSLLPR